MVQGVVLVTATVYVLLNLMADMRISSINPRLRASMTRCRARPPSPLPTSDELGQPGAARAAPAVHAQGRGGRTGRDRDLHRARGCSRP